MRQRSIKAVSLLLLTALASAFGAIKEAASLAQEKREVDALIQRADSTELRKLSPRILRLAEDLRVAKGDAEARSYFEKGLEGNAWALDAQLTLGEILARSGKPEALRENAEMVLRLGEDDAVLQRASKLLARPLPPAASPFSEYAETETSLVLVPVGPVSAFTLHDLKADLAKRLGFPVVVATVELKPLKPDRSARQQWIARTRERILETAKAQPGFSAQIRRMGWTLEQVEKDDATVLALARKIAEAEQGTAGLQALDAMLAQIEPVQQFDVENVLRALQPAVTNRAGRKLLVLGVTEHDLFGGTSNYLFGAGAIGKFVGVVSAVRFHSAFNGEPPKRQRLIERLAKQCLSTIGFMAGIPRCTTPECVRAYPQSLAEHDQKPGTMCPTCRKGLEDALERKLPAD